MEFRIQTAHRGEGLGQARQQCAIALARQGRSGIRNRSGRRRGGCVGGVGNGCKGRGNDGGVHGVDESLGRGREPLEGVRQLGQICVRRGEAATC